MVNESNDRNSPSENSNTRCIRGSKRDDLDQSEVSAVTASTEIAAANAPRRFLASTFSMEPPGIHDLGDDAGDTKGGVQGLCGHVDSAESDSASGRSDNERSCDKLGVSDEPDSDESACSWKNTDGVQGATGSSVPVELAQRTSAGHFEKSHGTAAGNSVAPKQLHTNMNSAMTGSTLAMRLGSDHLDPSIDDGETQTVVPLATPMQDGECVAQELADEPGGDADNNDVPTIEGYEILRCLGEGGMGSVYLAKDLTLEHLVAIKCPLRKKKDLHKAMGQASDEQFLEEARKLAQIRHPRIVPVYKAGIDRGRPYFAMQYVDGTNASRLVGKLTKANPHKMQSEALRAKLGIKKGEESRELRRILDGADPYYRLVAWWIAGVADGLHQVHKRNILHRDIKPSNLILAGDGAMLLADFGLARTTEELSRSGGWGVTGTYPYTPPEKIAGDWAMVDHRADVYSLGATMYELLTYRRAYLRSGADVLQDVASKDPDVPRSIIKEVPRELEAICLQAMHRTPENRFATSADMADALHAWLGIRRNTRVLWTGASVLAVAAFGWIGIAQTQQSVKPAPKSEPVRVVDQHPNLVTAEEEPQSDTEYLQEKVVIGGVASSQELLASEGGPTSDSAVFLANKVGSPIVFLDLSSVLVDYPSCPMAADWIRDKFSSLNKVADGDTHAVDLRFAGEAAAEFKIVGAVDVSFDRDLSDLEFGKCELAVSFDVLKRDNQSGGWKILGDEKFTGSASPRIQAGCAAVKHQLRGITQSIIARIYDRIAVELEEG